MKKILITILIACLPANIFTNNCINQNEYNQLLQQCHTIANRIRKNNDFEPIRQQALKGLQQIHKSIAERFATAGNSGGYKSILDKPGSEFAINLEVIRINHERQVNSLISNTIFIYLRSIGSPTAIQLLTDLTLKQLIG